MTIKILQPAQGKGGSAILAVDGKLRVVDPIKLCAGYSTGCLCPKCSEREARMRRKRSKLDALPARLCACDRPRVGTERRCERCGKSARLVAA